MTDLLYGAAKLIAIAVSIKVVGFLIKKSKGFWDRI